MNQQIQKNLKGVQYKVNTKAQLERFEDFDYVGKQQIQQTVDQQPSQQPSALAAAESFQAKPVDDKYQSVSLPSGFIFYPFKSISVRKFEIRDLSKMHQAAQTESAKLFKQVIQNCVADVDVNDLVPGDFKYLCYWLRFNSYTKTPITINWRSKYGNDNVQLVYKTDVQPLAPDITEQQYQQWVAEGFQAPTVKFTDIFAQPNFPKEDEMLYSNAQYFAGDTWEQKIETMEKFVNENGLEALQKVYQFDSLIECGVQEEVKVTDLKFDPKTYLGRLQDKLTNLKAALNQVDQVDSNTTAVLRLTYETIEQEYQDLKTKIDNGEEVLAEPESIFLELDATEFLSPLLPAIH